MWPSEVLGFNRTVLFLVSGLSTQIRFQRDNRRAHLDWCEGRQGQSKRVPVASSVVVVDGLRFRPLQRLQGRL